MIILYNPRDNKGKKVILYIVAFIVMSAVLYLYKHPELLFDKDVNLRTSENSNKISSLSTEKSLLDGLKFADMMSQIDYIYTNMSLLIQDKSDKDIDQWKLFLNESKSSLETLEHHPNYQLLFDDLFEIIDTANEVVQFMESGDYLNTYTKKNTLSKQCDTLFNHYKVCFDKSKIEYRYFEQDGQQRVQYKYKRY